MSRKRSIIVVTTAIAVLVCGALLVNGSRLSQQRSLNNALCDAVLRTNVQAVHDLLQKHADPNSHMPVPVVWAFWRSSGNRTSVLRAAVELLSEHAMQVRGQTPTAQQCQEVVLDLLNAGANARPANGESSLVGLTLPGRMNETTQALLKHGAPLPGPSGNTSVLASAINWRNSPDTIRALIAAGCVVKGEAGREALVFTYGRFDVSQGHVPADAVEIFKILLDAGADPNTQVSGHSMLYDDLLFAQGREFSRLLLQAHANLNDTPKGMEPIMFAALESRPEVLGWLLDAGADANQKEANGEPVLSYAVIHQISESDAVKSQKVEMLLRHGADPEAIVETEFGKLSVRAYAHRGATQAHISPQILTLLDRYSKKKSGASYR